MKSARRGAGTSQVEISGISRHGIWLYLEEREVFLPFKDFPWFREASVREIANVQLPSAHHLFWPDLDIDLAVESIEHPEKYPLVSKAQPNARMRRMPSSRQRNRAVRRRRR